MHEKQHKHKDMNDNKISSWILEYCYYLAREELRESQHIEQYMSRDFIQGALDQLETNELDSIRSRCMVQILVLMCKLADGQDTKAEYERSDPKMTILEEAADLMGELLDGLRWTDYDHDGDLIDLNKLVKQQAVFVYVRKEDFSKAATIAKRLYGFRPIAGEKEFKQRVWEVLKANDPEHPLLSQYSYEKLLETWFSTLTHIETALKINTPFLVEFAEQYTAYQSGSGQEKTWEEEFDAEFRAEVVKALVEHFCPESVLLSRRKHFPRKQQRTIPKNKDVHEVTTEGEGDTEGEREGNSNVNARSESETELPTLQPPKRRRKRTQSASPKKPTLPPRNNRPKQNTPTENAIIVDTESDEEVIVDTDTDEAVHSDDAEAEEAATTEAATPSSSRSLGPRLASSTKRESSPLSPDTSSESESETELPPPKRTRTENAITVDTESDEAVLSDDADAAEDEAATPSSSRSSSPRLASSTKRDFSPDSSSQSSGLSTKRESSPHAPSASSESEIELPPPKRTRTENAITVDTDTDEAVHSDDADAADAEEAETSSSSSQSSGLSTKRDSSPLSPNSSSESELDLLPPKRTRKKTTIIVDTESDEEVDSDDSDSAEEAAAIPSSSRSSGRLASSTRPPRTTPPPRRTLNVDRLSHLSVGGKAKRPWEQTEEECVWEGVQEFGVGKWAQIKASQELTQRSSVDIKDKWRNIVKDKRKFRALEAKLGSIPARAMKRK